MYIIYTIFFRAFYTQVHTVWIMPLYMAMYYIIMPCTTRSLYQILQCCIMYIILYMYVYCSYIYFICKWLTINSDRYANNVLWLVGFRFNYIIYILMVRKIKRKRKKYNSLICQLKYKLHLSPTSNLLMYHQG